MELPKSKPSAAKIENMKEAGRQEYKNNKARVITHLKSRGLSNAAIAGIVGNIDVETGGSFDYTQKQTKSGDPRSSDIVKGGGYGLFQFDDPKNKTGHETWYKEYLKQTDKEDSTESQLDYFLDMIMAGEDSKDPFYKYSSNMGAGNAGVIKAYLQTNQNPRQISDAITDRFEKASIKHSNRRREAAETVFAELKPSDRMDVDPNAQYINQSGNILDTGKDIPMEDEKFPMERVQDIPEEKSMYESIKPYVPVLRHFNEGGAVSMQKQMEMFDEGGMSTKKDSIEDLVDTFEITPEMQESMDKMTKEEQDAMRKKLIAKAMERMLAKPLPKDIDFSKIARQYNEGGLMDEGGSVDPVSGNDVPPGSTQEEVRDDIPAQLSEGEFVFPADVVRFIGLNNLMQMRQQAKMGLKQMEEMGQMGNSEEATMPDDLPFDINDLDMEDELEYNVGGFVPGTVEQQQYGISGMQQAAAPTTGVAAVPQQAASSQYVQPVQAAVPTAPVYKPAEVPTFKGFVGENIPGVDFEYVEYKNEAGNIIKIRKSKTTGDLLDPVPEGYTFVDPEATKVEEATVAPTAPQTTSVREEPEGDAGVGQGGAFGDMEKMNQRTDLAKRMGFTEFQNPIAGLVGAVMGTSGAGEQGTITGTGYILDGQGGMYDPITGYKVNTGLVSAIKQDFSLIGKGPMGRNIAKKAEAQKTQFGRDVYNKASEMKVIDKYDALIQEAKDRGDSDSASTAETIKKTMRNEAKKGNIDLRTGMVINPNELAGARKAVDTSGDQTDQTTPDFGLVANPPDPVGPDRGPQTGGGPSQDDAPASDGSEQQSDGYGGLGHATGGLISKPKPKVKKKMKRGGLASKK